MGFRHDAHLTSEPHAKVLAFQFSASSSALVPAGVTLCFTHSSSLNAQQCCQAPSSVLGLQTKWQSRERQVPGVTQPGMDGLGGDRPARLRPPACLQGISPSFLEEGVSGALEVESPGRDREAVALGKEGRAMEESRHGHTGRGLDGAPTRTVKASRSPRTRCLRPSRNVGLETPLDIPEASPQLSQSTPNEGGLDLLSS